MDVMIHVLSCRDDYHPVSEAIFSHVVEECNAFFARRYALGWTVDDTPPLRAPPGTVLSLHELEVDDGVERIARDDHLSREDGRLFLLLLLLWVVPLLSKYVSDPSVKVPDVVLERGEQSRLFVFDAC